VNALIRTALMAILSDLQTIEDNYQIRTEGEIVFKNAKVQLENMLTEPDAEPATATSTVVLRNDQVADLASRVDGLGQNVIQRLGLLEAAVIKLINTPAAAAAPATDSAPAPAI